MLVCKTRRWGSSIGLIIPKSEVNRMNIKEDQEIIVEIIKKENPLKELYGFGKKNRILEKDFLITRKILESKT